MVLRTDHLISGYGKVMILKGINVEVDKGEIVSIIGRNGVGKSTFMKTVIGILKTHEGAIEYRGEDITKTRAYSRAQAGMGYVPQGHGIFPMLTVRENLEMGQMINGRGHIPDYDLVYSYFPRLKERLDQMAGTMSGGEQAMLSIGRVLTGKPDILLLDEPSEGVQPNIVEEIGEIILKISKDLGIAILLVEQHMGLIQQVTQRGYVIDKGAITAALDHSDIENRETLRSFLTV